VFWVISVYFNIRNALPKYYTFLPGHPVYVTRLASNKIFSTSNKIHREVGWVKDLSAPLYLAKYFPVRVQEAG
jgi:hypothetical protein